MPLRLLINVEAEEGPEDGEEIHAQDDAEGNLQEYEIERQRRMDARCQRRGENVLWRHDVQNLT